SDRWSWARIPEVLAERAPPNLVVTFRARTYLRYANQFRGIRASCSGSGSGGRSKTGRAAADPVLLRRQLEKGADGRQVRPGSSAGSLPGRSNRTAEPARRRSAARRRDRLVVRRREARAATGAPHPEGKLGDGGRAG